MRLAQEVSGTFRPNVPFSVGDQDPHVVSLHGSLVYMSPYSTYGSAIFAGVTVMTKTQTDHATPSVATARIHHCVLTMRPKSSTS